MPAPKRRSTRLGELPSAVAQYFAATNDHDVDGILALFADHAVVKDEGQEHRGSVAISKWMREATSKYDFQVEPAGVVERDGQTIVTGLVSGSFPGSPVSLRHEFTLDHEKIIRLEIG